jgi:hypothetical protein
MPVQIISPTSDLTITRMRFISDLNGDQVRMAAQNGEVVQSPTFSD